MKWVIVVDAALMGGTVEILCGEKLRGVTTTHAVSCNKHPVGARTTSGRRASYINAMSTQPTYQDDDFASGIDVYEATCTMLPREQDTLLLKAHWDAGMLHGPSTATTTPGSVNRHLSFE